MFFRTTMACNSDARLFGTLLKRASYFRSNDQFSKLMGTTASANLFKSGRPILSSSSWLHPNLASKYQQWSNFSTLPKLPIPPLRQTLQRFLAVAKPLTSSKQEFDEIQKIVDEFGAPNGVGERLQTTLEKRAQRLTNWLSDWWLQKAYLELRCPLPINVSPGMLLPLQNYSDIKGQVEFASKLVVAALRFRDLIEKKDLPVDTASNQPLDMSQYEFLFGTTRIPGEKQDTLRYGCNELEKANHIVVARNNKFFSVPVFASNGDLLSAAQIAKQLDVVVAESQTRLPTSDAIGLLTTEDRGVWGKVNSCMKNNQANAKSFERIETGIFVLCLDQPYAEQESRLSAAGNQMLHGGGSNVNTGNRWFDKCLQLVVGHSGGCGLTYEHSPAEGPPVASLLDFSIDYIQQNANQVKSTASPFDSPQELEFVLTESDRNRIRAAAQKIDGFINDTELYILLFDQFGKNVPKSHKLSPDSFVQLGLQLTFFKLHNECPATYETGTLRRFKLGRTDTIRLPTVESACFVQCMRDQSTNAKQRADALRKAVQSHKDYTAAACSGNGIDRHLLGLKLTALEAGQEVPPLLKSKIYEKMLHYKLSTSQVTSKHDACMMFGPMYSDCYGVCYNPQEKQILVSVSAFNSCAETSAKRFGRVLSESFLEMRDVLVNSASPVRAAKL